MNEIYAKLDSLQKNIDSQLKKSKSSLLMTTIFYAIIVVFVAIYTTYIMQSIKVIATPDVVAEYLAENIQNQIPLITEDINKNVGRYADILADKSVDGVRSLIPSLEFLIMNQLDLATGIINNEMNNKYYPALDEYFKLNKANIVEVFNTMTDQDAANALVDMIIKDIDEHLELINLPFIESVTELRNKIEKLATTPNDKLTRQELAEKHVIAYWVFLLNSNHPIGRINILKMD